MPPSCYGEAEHRQRMQQPRKDLINARHTMPYKRKLDYALTQIKVALSGSKNPRVAVSGGLDSMAMLHMIRQIQPVRAIWINSGIELPETKEYMANVTDVDTLHPKRTFWEICEEFGYPGQSRINNQPACCRWLKEYPMRDYIKENGIDLIFTGLIASEGQHRRYNFILRGAYYRHIAWDTMKSTPIILFLKDDVWKYTKNHQIPVNAAYEKYDIQRIGCMACTGYKGWRTQMKKVNPDLYRFMNEQIKKKGLS